MKTVAIGFTIAAVASPVVIELIRSIVDHRRQRRIGIAGTQDIAMLGSLIGWALAGVAIVCWIIHLKK